MIFLHIILHSAVHIYDFHIFITSINYMQIIIIVLSIVRLTTGTHETLNKAKTKYIYAPEYSVNRFQGMNFFSL